MSRKVIIILVMLMEIATLIITLPWTGVAAQHVGPTVAPSMVDVPLSPPGEYTYVNPTALRSINELPSRVDLSEGIPPVSSQGNGWDCAAWSVGYYFKTWQEYQEHHWDLTDPAHQVSASYLYNLRPYSDCEQDEGMAIPDVLNILRDKGAAPRSVFDSSDPCLVPPPEADKAAAPFRISSYSAVFIGLGSGDPLAVKQVLASENLVIVVVSIYSSFFWVSANDPVIPMPSPGETYYGRHSLTLVGYNDQIQAFRTCLLYTSPSPRD